MPFPAHAGVFPSRGSRSCCRSTLPRARGGVPSWPLSTSQRSSPSPRTRGCSHAFSVARLPRDPFPAHAGVFPLAECFGQPRGTLPRARGGVPKTPITDPALTAPSPRTRGCSPKSISEKPSCTPFPAHAGVFPLIHRSLVVTPTLPRARGGVPRCHDTQSTRENPSPRTRGCSRELHAHLIGQRPFPAHAGVFP